MLNRLNDCAPTQLLPPPLPIYSSLAPMRDWLQLGMPILMYHKLGPRPRGTRIKGLYVGDALFRKQLRELKRAHFVTPLYDDALNPTPNTSRIILTFDDGFENVFARGMEPLHQHGFRAIQFLVADRLGKTNDWETRDGEAEERLMDAEQVKEWLAVGNEIGSHTLTHPHLTQLPTGRAREEIQASRKRLEDEFQLPIQHFCYPFGDFNESIADLVREAGYVSACSTHTGMNTSATDPYRLERIMSRHATRQWVQIRRRWSLRMRQIFSR